MSIDTVQPALNVQAVYPRQEANGQSGRETRRDGEPGQPEQEQQNQEQVFRNTLGEITGKTINTTA
jgi:hypothetical protein